MSPCANGMPNAAVLPEPVRDCTITSLPAIMRGKTARCTGIGIGEAHLEQRLLQLRLDAELPMALRDRRRCDSPSVRAARHSCAPCAGTVGSTVPDSTSVFIPNLQLHCDHPGRAGLAPRRTLLLERLARRFERVSDVLDARRVMIDVIVEEHRIGALRLLELVVDHRQVVVRRSEPMFPSTRRIGSARRLPVGAAASSWKTPPTARLARCRSARRALGGRRAFG